MSSLNSPPEETPTQETQLQREWQYGLSVVFVLWSFLFISLPIETQAAHAAEGDAFKWLPVEA